MPRYKRNSAVLICGSDWAAEASLAAILARSKLGIATAAMIRMIATHDQSSISENPLLSRVFTLPCLCFYSEVIS